MPLTPSTVGHTIVGGNDRISVFDDGASNLTQAMAIVDSDNALAGVTGNPIRAEPSPPASRYVTGGALENTAQVKGSAGTLKEITVTMDAAASARYLHIFDSIAALAGGETPVARFLIPAGGMISYTPPGGLALATGILVATSSTLATYTSPGDTLAAFQADYD